MIGRSEQDLNPELTGQENWLAGFVQELGSFAGLGPELNNSIIETNKRIIGEPNTEEKILLTRERNKILHDFFIAGLTDLYGDQGQKLAQRILDKINQIEEFEKIPQKPQKKEVCYIVYPDTFKDINGLITILPKLSEMGVTKLHILPFFDNSGDKGFSVRVHSLDKPLRMREDWSLNQFKELVNLADKLGISLLVDVILNHMATDSPILENPTISEQLIQSWIEETIPFKFKKTRDDEETGGTYATYELTNGNPFEVLIMFPEQTREKEDPLLAVRHRGRKDERLELHTFYDFQVDLDFSEPVTFELVSNIILQTIELIGRKGQLRLDAISFIGKLINLEIFKNMDNDDGYKIITLIKILTTLSAPDVNLIAEASRPLSEIEKYLKRVGGAYDFISLPYFLLAVAEGKSELFLNKIDEMVDFLGLEELEKLAIVIQSHDDFPIAELRDKKIAKEVWSALKGKGALAFGQKEGRNGIPKGAAVRLAELCDHNPDKIAATIALASFTPHGDLFLLFGTETGLRNSQEALEAEKVDAIAAGRSTDYREVIRGQLDVDKYIEQLDDSETFVKVSKVVQMRKEFLPEEISEWKQTVTDGLVEINISGKKDNQDISIKILINYSDEIKNGIDAWGYKIIKNS